MRRLSKRFPHPSSARYPTLAPGSARPVLLHRFRLGHLRFKILWWFSDDSLMILWRFTDGCVGGGGRSCPRRCCCYHYQTWRKLLLQLKLAIWLTLVTLKPWHASAGKTDTSFQLSFARNPSGAKKKRKSLYDLVRVCVCVCVHVHVMVLSKLHLDPVISSIQLECFMGDNSNP